MAPGVAPLYYDVTGDRLLTPLDALQVVNYLNQPHAVVWSGEGEGSSRLIPSPVNVQVNPLHPSAVVASSKQAEGEAPFGRVAESPTATGAPVATASALAAPGRTVRRVTTLEPMNLQAAEFEDILTAIADDVAAVWCAEPR